ncbi:glycosyltransferase [Tenacibaculum sp. UWU-22]|uniref:glycosyltransferase n=1 Tax=Tenacibaculum sp. UWU-22 TaxID=3234187 RepID=UPI0034DB49C7
MIITILFYIFVVAVSIQIIYYILLSTFAFSKTENTIPAKQNNPVSVIVYAKNKAQDLQKFIPCIINQNYSNFEILIVNNASTDTTLEVIENFQKHNTNITLIDVENNETFWGNKKYAITLGIKAAKNPYLIFTEADCKPVSKNWIAQLMGRFSEEKQIVLGYVTYPFKNYSFFNLVLHFDSLLNAIQCFASTKLGYPYKGMSKNIAYTKSEFFKAKGYVNHIKIYSGDNDFFIQDAATNTNTTFCASAESFVYSNPPKSFKLWLLEKSRQFIGCKNYYKTKHRFFIGLIYWSKLVFYLLSIILLFLFDSKIIISFIGLYYLINWIVIGLSAKKLKETKLLILLPFLDIILLLIHFTIFITAKKISKSTTWE